MNNVPVPGVLSMTIEMLLLSLANWPPRAEVSEPFLKSSAEMRSTWYDVHR